MVHKNSRLPLYLVVLVEALDSNDVCFDRLKLHTPFQCNLELNLLVHVVQLDSSFKTHEKEEARDK